MRSIREVAEATITVLNEHEWTKGVEYQRIYPKPGGTRDAVCAMGAMKAARVGLAQLIYYSPTLIEAEILFMARFAEVHNLSLTTFNDAAKSKQDVIDAINDVIKKEIERS